MFGKVSVLVYRAETVKQINVSKRSLIICLYSLPIFNNQIIDVYQCDIKVPETLTNFINRDHIRRLILGVNTNRDLGNFLLY